MRNDLAPIVLFVYNRPEHTKKVLKCLKLNNIASESELIIYADGPKPDASNNDISRILEVRKIIKGIDFLRKTRIIESEKNKGLSNSIIEGVTKVVNEFGKIIVIEDDLETSSSFLEYMNEALTVYQNFEKVMQISGFMYPVENNDLHETFFLRSTSTWGWATWNRAWKSFEADAKSLYKRIPDKSISKFNLNNAYDYYGMLYLQANNKIDSWGIRWYASVFLKDGLCLYPYKSLVYNIGQDGSGVHCGITDFFDSSLYQNKINNFAREIEEDSKALNKIIEYMSTGNKVTLNKRSFFKSILSFLKKYQNEN